MVDSPSYVLSIQSHVAYGYVGNSAAVFALQRLGIPVLAVNTVQFSNHTGYGKFRGSIFAPDDLRAVITGLQERNVLANCAAVLSGYLGTAASGDVVLYALDLIRQVRPATTYLCDPVIGDIGRGIFVNEGIPEFLAQKALPTANIITPNQFEFEYLTGHKLTNTEDAVNAARKLINQFSRLNAVIITSLLTSDLAKGQMRTLAVTAQQSWAVDTPLVDLNPLPNGMGDLFSAIFLGKWLLSQRYDTALQQAVTALFSMINTVEKGSRDLPLIKQQQAIFDPQPLFAVQHLTNI